jgi:hypothetical protein
MIHPGLFIGAALAAALAACIDLPRYAALHFPSHVEGLPADGSWTALPLRAWLAEGEVRAEAVSACLDPCAPRVAVGVFRATGAQARALAAALRDPEGLARALEHPTRPDRPRAAARAQRLTGAVPGFALTLTRTDGTRPVHARVLARGADPLRFVLAIGEDPEAVARLAAEAATALR